MYYGNFNKIDSTYSPTLCLTGTLMIFYQKDAPKGWKIIDKNINTGCIICIKIKEE